MKSNKTAKKRKRGERVFAVRKMCRFCEQIKKSRQNSRVFIDYKNVEVLKKFVSERGRIIPRRVSGVCAKHQRELSKAIKRARNIALLPG
ncbi:MAG: 30S ribosomal protein S18 [Candidatus Omnitrophota bacterium]|nr:MAG: 30S ribosomal protein S18 [Candidatus Omnitrophota bacterium]